MNHGGTATCTASPAAGYTFGGWSGDCTGTGAWVLTNVTAAKSVTASFRLNSYAITATASPAAGGTVSCAPNPVEPSGTSTCTATPAAGYTFTGWSGACGGASCTLSGVTGPRSVVATFAGGASKTLTIPTATGTGEAGVSVAGGGEACGFSAARFVPVGSVATPPPATTTFPHGLFEFALTRCAAGGAVTLTVRYPGALPAGAAYWKYGPTPGQASPHGYRWPQATIAGDTVTFTLTDGGLGDTDLAANGTIVDPGGPAVAAVAEIPTLSEWARLMLLGLLVGMAGWTLRRQAAS